jgi:hypothetical protein
MAPARVWKRREMVERTALFARLWPVGGAAAVICLVLSYVSVAQAEDGWQWRINKLDDGRLLLAFSEFEASDDMSGRSYYCKPSSGSIEVHGITDKKQRQVFADLIRANSYPKVELESEGALPELSYSEVDGWEFRFSIAADGAAFDKFKKTGLFGFKIGTLVVNDKMAKAGLDKVAKFQAACRKPPANKVPEGPKAQ